MTIKLGPRLQQVAVFVKPGSRLGDIGTDHAYLPISLAEQGIIKSAVAVDVHQGPYQSAQKAVQERNLSAVIDVRFGDGLQPLRVGEVDTLTLAGMGGVTMLEILSDCPEIVAEVSSLILQPQGAESRLRKTLYRWGWKLYTECLTEEEDRIYNILVFHRDKGLEKEEILMQISQWQNKLQNYFELPDDEKRLLVARITETIVWQFGVLILAKPDELLYRLMAERIRSLGFRIQGMRKAKDPLTFERLEQTQLEAEILEIFLGILTKGVVS